MIQKDPFLIFPDKPQEYECQDRRLNESQSRLQDGFRQNIPRQLQIRHIFSLQDHTFLTDLLDRIKQPDPDPRAAQCKEHGLRTLIDLKYVLIRNHIKQKGDQERLKEQYGNSLLVVLHQLCVTPQEDQELPQCRFFPYLP